MMQRRIWKHKPKPGISRRDLVCHAGCGPFPQENDRPARRHQQFFLGRIDLAKRPRGAYIRDHDRQRLFFPVLAAS
jgi:hypothetical protein